MAKRAASPSRRRGHAFDRCNGIDRARPVLRRGGRLCDWTAPTVTWRARLAPIGCRHRRPRERRAARVASRGVTAGALVPRAAVPPGRNEPPRYSPRGGAIHRIARAAPPGRWVAFIATIKRLYQPTLISAAAHVSSEPVPGRAPIRERPVAGAPVQRADARRSWPWTARSRDTLPLPLSVHAPHPLAAPTSPHVNKGSLKFTR